ncbi:ribokinase [Asticcacaulis sp. YBE204]|uniref:ribokinase n=1 Tax=Asticcacaulis sp. YBE204 TaxID=1282363 RepID=UPI0003C3C476|nr:ribokinase [Asticcacaulis sp. YBE204]ESQ79065.1 carbohydrate kinase [Asticcacaulis sp. YBE204]
MSSIVVLGSINVDFFIRVDALPKPNETIMGHDTAVAMGGKGLNQAVAAARSGVEARMIGAVGSDNFGVMARDFLKARGVNDDHVVALDGVGTGMANILVAPDGQNMIVVSSAANARLTPDHAEQNQSLIENAGALVVQLETPLETLKAALEIAMAAGVKTILNPAPVDQGVFDLLPLCEVVTPNETELAKLTGIDGQDDAALITAMQTLRAHGAETVIVTLGDKGCAGLIDGELIRLPAFKVEAVDAVGAGDVFNGALAARLVLGDDYVRAMRYASAASAISVTRYSADAAPTMAEVEAFLAERP